VPEYRTYSRVLEDILFALEADQSFGRLIAPFVSDQQLGRRATKLEGDIDRRHLRRTAISKISWPLSRAACMLGFRGQLSDCLRRSPVAFAFAFAFPQ